MTERGIPSNAQKSLKTRKPHPLHGQRFAVFLTCFISAFTLYQRLCCCSFIRLKTIIHFTKQGISGFIPFPSALPPLPPPLNPQYFMKIKFAFLRRWRESSRREGSKHQKEQRKLFKTRSKTVSLASSFSLLPSAK